MFFSFQDILNEEQKTRYYLKIITDRYIGKPYTVPTNRLRLVILPYDCASVNLTGKSVLESNKTSLHLLLYLQTLKILLGAQEVRRGRHICTVKKLLHYFRSLKLNALLTLPLFIQFLKINLTVQLLLTVCRFLLLSFVIYV